MIAVDTNIIVYAHREDSPFHSAALETLKKLNSTGSSWGIPWPCIHEFLAIITHPKIYSPPTELQVALETVADIANLNKVTFLHESENHLEILENLLTISNAGGPKVHDARIAAICLGNGVSEVWTADRDFSYFPQIKTRNPLIKAQ